MKYLALGDSYTIGECVAQNQTWPFLLHSSPKVIATTGWTTSNLLEAIASENINETYDIVSLLIGVNNQYRALDFSIYERELKTLLNKSISLCSQGENGVFVVSIPDYGVTPFAENKSPEKIDSDLMRYNAYAQQLCEEMNVPFIDIYDISKLAKNDASLTAEDQLHPSAEMYALWAERIKPTFEILKNYL